LIRGRHGGEHITVLHRKRDHQRRALLEKMRTAKAMRYQQSLALQ
jgi:hypothetical protein